MLSEINDANYTDEEKQQYGTKGKYSITANWYHTEVRIIYADTKEDAIERVEDGDWDEISGWNLTGFIGVESIRKAVNGKWKQLNINDF